MKHIGSDFDAFLEEEGSLAEVETAALRRVIVYQVGEQTKQQRTRTDQDTEGRY